MDDLFFIDTKGTATVRFSAPKETPAISQDTVQDYNDDLSDDMAQDYMDNLSEDGLEYLMSANTTFLTRDLGGHKSAHATRAAAAAAPADEASSSSDDFVVDDPFKFEDQLAELILDGSDAEDIDVDGFPYNIDLDMLAGPTTRSQTNGKRKPRGRQVDTEQQRGKQVDTVQKPAKDQGRTKGRQGRHKHKQKQSEPIGPSPGFDPRKVLKRLDTLVDTDELDSMWLQPMNKYERQIVHIFAREYKIKSKSQGSGTRRTPVLTPTANSCRPKNRRRINRVVLLFDEGGLVPEQWTGELPNDKPSGRGKGKNKDSSARTKAPRDTGASDGKMVAENAPEVGASNIGHQMLQQMGWTPGQGLGGDAKGRALPVDVMIRTGRRGLGT
ncbi:squalene synthetase-like protein [Coemansia sp. RSA 2523]|nr:squalene synthetase-like protein [Coemansia sp. RSA 2523]KAJ2130596.1 squalene synthetase-like protein [Coemansia sp. RSA 921]KAJ2138616.1 squalene synthetase-like protein [Coemansia sp. RSA 788]KAJ2147478.1 squalene synthetase-like protein [Coemansia sp. RSA 637]KAJ2149457.1 squalene synthetase-like protein [Coemansia sp. RSA 564]KAJ2166709.1 squalene synthetase-like protein [Coemansia sp. RSA 562]KAJ2175520.1 squalene synthetase-like protein [Coemansia sp. RSA 560]KAJ2188430.1 squalene 